MCEDRFGGGSFIPWHVPPPVRFRAYALSSLTPPQGGVKTSGSSTESRSRGFFNNPDKWGVEEMLSLTRGCRGGPACPPARETGFFNGPLKGVILFSHWLVCCSRANSAPVIPEHESRRQSVHFYLNRSVSCPSGVWVPNLTRASLAVFFDFVTFLRYSCTLS